MSGRITQIKQCMQNPNQNSPLNILSNDVTCKSTLIKWTAFATVTPSTTAAPTPRPLLLIFNTLGPLDQTTLYIGQLNVSVLFQVSAGDAGFVVNLVQTDQIFLPYKAGSGIQFSPDTTLSTGMNFPIVIPLGRWTSGEFTIRSNQTSTTSGALSGTIGGGINTLGVFNLFNNNYTQAAIQQRTVAHKDSLIHVQVMNGMKTIVATDIAEFNNAASLSYAPTLSTSVMTSVTPPAYPSGASVMTFTNPTTSALILSSYITSPTANATTLPMPPLSPFAAVTIKLEVHSTDAVENYIYVVHYYGTYDPSTGLPNFATRTFDLLPVAPIYPVALGPIVSGPPTQSLYTTAIYIPHQLYLGSIFICHPITAGPPAATVVVMSYTISTPSTTAILGPSRIIRVDNTAPNQQVVINGKLTAQMLPGTVAPYVNSSGALDVSTEEIEILRMQYNSEQDETACRIMAEKQSEKFVSYGDSVRMGENKKRLRTTTDHE